MAEIRFLNIGVTFQRTIRDQDGDIVNIAGAVGRYFYFKRPDETVFRVSTTFTTDGTDGNMQYTTGYRDLDLPGLWTLQARVTDNLDPLLATYDLWTNEWDFDVIENLEQGIRLLSVSISGYATVRGNITS
jgi:hypothetical protein